MFDVHIGVKLVRNAQPCQLFFSETAVQFESLSQFEKLGWQISFPMSVI